MGYSGTRGSVRSARKRNTRPSGEPGVLVRMSGAGEQSTISEPTDEDITAVVVHDVDHLVRHGQVAQAARRAGCLPPLGPDPLGALLSRLSDSGYEEEAALVELAWRQPIVIHVLAWAHRLGWIGAFLTFVVCFWPARAFAAIPAMGARLLVSELYVQFVGRRVLESLPQGDRRRARTLFDLSIYSTRGINRLGSVDAVMLTLGGVVLYGGSVWARTTVGSEWFVWAMTASGTTMAFAGVFAVAATRRIAHSGIKAPEELKELPPPPVERPPALPIEHPVAFAQPRRGRSMLLPAFLFIVGVPTIMEATPAWVPVGALCLVVAGWFVYRAMRSVVVIGPDGVRYVGAIWTREWPWDEIHAVRLVTAKDSDRTQSLRMVTRGGSDRTLVADAGRAGANPELLRLCESMNQHATAPNPGPTRRERAPRLVGLAAIVFFFVVLGLFAETAVLSGGSVEMRASEVPAGRTYTYYQRADGSTSPAFMECPSLASWVSGADDPLCAESYRNSAIAAGVLLVLELALVAGAVHLARASLRLHRESKVARHVTVGTGA